MRERGIAGWEDESGGGAEGSEVAKGGRGR